MPSHGPHSLKIQMTLYIGCYLTIIELISFCYENSHNILHQGTEETENCRLPLLRLTDIQRTLCFTV